MKKIIGIILIILICLASGFFFIKYKFNNENTFMEQTLNAFKDEERLKKQKYLQCMNEPFKDTVVDEIFADISNIYAKSGVAIYFKDLNNDYELKVNENKIYYSASTSKVFVVIYLLEKYRNTGWKKFYLIFGMCDESFTVNCTVDPPEDVDRGWFM